MNDPVSEREPREQSENALALARESFDLIFEDAPVMMHSINEEGKLLRVNRRWAETLGYDCDEAVGHKSSCLWCASAPCWASAAPRCITCQPRPAPRTWS